MGDAEEDKPQYEKLETFVTVIFPVEEHLAMLDSKLAAAVSAAVMQAVRDYGERRVIKVSVSSTMKPAPHEYI